MDPDTPRTIGDIEESEPVRTAPGRSVPAKKTLEQFLDEFEERLRSHPDQPATSASAALAGRAEGVWRTPVEGAERPIRRLPRGHGRPPAAPLPAAPQEPALIPEPAVLAPESAPPAPPQPQAAAADTPAGRRRNRRQRRHRRR